MTSLLRLFGGVMYHMSNNKKIMSCTLHAFPCSSAPDRFSSSSILPRLLVCPTRPVPRHRSLAAQITIRLLLSPGRERPGPHSPRHPRRGPCHARTPSIAFGLSTRAGGFWSSVVVVVAWAEKKERKKERRKKKKGGRGLLRIDREGAIVAARMDG